jgi:hypothetical protein
MTLLRRNINQHVADGLDFMLAILPSGNEFPRNILVGSYQEPYKVWNKADILYRYKAMLYEDCYLNAFPNYQWMIDNGDLPPTYRPPPNHLMVDLDREDFVDERAFQQAVDFVKANISKHIKGITGKYPIIVDSGNGYHIHVPMPGIRNSFEEVPEFAQFKTDKPSELDQIFLRYLENKLTGGKADKRHKPSVNSLMFRVPGTINTKARDRGRAHPYVRVVEGHKHVNMLIARERWMPHSFKVNNASRPTDELLNDFYLYLMHKKVDSRVEDSERTEKRLWQSLEPKRADADIGIIPWIEKILQVGVEDQRKDLLFWLLAPYLITIKRLDHEQAFDILDGWLAKCNEVRRLEPKLSEFRRRVNHCLKHCTDKLEDKEPWWPISFETFQEYYPDLYRELFSQ